MKASLPILFLIFSHICAEIIQVQFITRHGDRTPVSDRGIPNNFVDYQKEFGLAPGQLTGLGMSQCYQLGIQIRHRYLQQDSPNRISQISQQYQSLDYKFVSSSIERTVQSAWSISMGLFPQGNGPIDHVNQQLALPNGTTPVPILSRGPDNDVLLRGFHICPGAHDLREAFYSTAEYKEEKKKYDSFIENLKKWTGIYDFDIEHFYDIYDLITVQRAHNLLNITEILENYDTIEEIADFSNYNAFRRETLKNLGGGLLVKEIIEQMELAIERDMTGKTTGYKFIHYSAHDTTVSSVMTALRMNEDHKDLRRIPSYGSGLFFELHKQTTEPKYFVKIFFKRGFNGSFVQYGLNSLGGGCEDECPFNKFKEIAHAEAIPQNWCGECNNDYSFNCLQENLARKKSENVVLLIVVVSGSTLAGLIGLILVSLFVINKSKKWFAYKRFSKSMLDPLDDGFITPRSLELSQIGEKDEKIDGL